MPMVIAKATAAADSDVLHVAASIVQPVTFVPVGTLGSSEITVSVIDEDDSSNPLYDADGSAVTLSATSAPLSFYAPIWVQFSKPSTTAAAGLMKVV